MQVFTLNQGIYSVDASKKFIPFNPQTDNFKDRPGSLFISVQPFLVAMADKLVLIDTGLGMMQNDELLLHTQIKEAGFSPDDVDMVLMTHLHFDHAAGLVMQQGDDMKLSFPHARHIIQRGEWEFAYTRDSASYRPYIFEYLMRNADIEMVEGDGSAAAQISYAVSGGHTPYHQVFTLEEDGKKVFMGGDVLAEPEELKRKFAAKYDYDGKHALEMRWQYGQRAADENMLCLFYHGKDYGQGYVTAQDGAFKVSEGQL